MVKERIRRTLKQNPNSSTFCILPFIHINASVTGAFKPCCNTWDRFSDIPRETSFWDAFNSKEMDEVREMVNNNQRPSICDICWKNEEKGIGSQRQHNNRKYSNFIEEGKDAKLEYIDVKFDNKCNLQCRMCDPFSSDQIWKTLEQVEKVPGHLQHIKITKEEYQKRSFSHLREKDIIENLHSVKVLKVTGGEPFVSNNFLNVLHKAVETGDSKHISLGITTNGTKFNRKVTELFEHFNAIDLNISVDGCFETYDYIRYPFTWKRWSDRVIDFLSDMEDMEHPNFSYRFSTVVTAYNYLNLCELQKNIDYIVGMFPTLTEKKYINSFDFDLKPDTSELHAKYLPDELLLAECEKAKELFNIKYKTHPLNNLYEFVHSYLGTETKKKELKESSIIIDKVRNQSYETLHPMLVEWLNE